jgi:hypothetical protein
MPRCGLIFIYIYICFYIYIYIYIFVFVPNLALELGLKLAPLEASIGKTYAGACVFEVIEKTKISFFA